MFEIHKADHAVFILALFLRRKLSCRFYVSILEPAKFCQQMRCYLLRPLPALPALSPLPLRPALNPLPPLPASRESWFPSITTTISGLAIFRGEVVQPANVPESKKHKAIIILFMYMRAPPYACVTWNSLNEQILMNTRSIYLFPSSTKCHHP